MADSANTGSEVDECDGMVVDWSDLTEEDRIVIAEVVAQHFWKNFLYKINILRTPIGIKKIFFTYFCRSFIPEHFCH